MLLKESVDMEINALVWFRWMKKKTSSLIEDKRKDKVHKAYTCWNPKRHIPPVSLLLWSKMVTVRCFVQALACDCGQAVSEAVRLNLEFKKKLYLATCFVVFYVLYGLVLFRKGDFCRINVCRMIFKGRILGSA